MSNPSAQRFVSVDELTGRIKKQDEMIRNLRIQLQTHRHMLSSLAEMPSEHMCASTKEFLKLPWGMHGE